LADFGLKTVVFAVELMKRKCRESEKCFSDSLSLWKSKWATWDALFHRHSLLKVVVEDVKYVTVLNARSHIARWNAASTCRFFLVRIHTAFFTCATAFREMFWRVCFVLYFPPFCCCLEHRRSVCDSALEILDEVRQSNPSEVTGRWLLWPWKNEQLWEPWRSPGTV
jgi:hypothetical protein